MTPVETVLHFLVCINQRDRGREAMRKGWQSYFGLCPDYWVSHEEVFSNRNQVAVFGAAGGTIGGDQWRVTAAWLAIVENGLVKEWRVYADNKPVYDILAKAKAQ
jgi:hypothetical protein